MDLHAWIAQQVDATEAAARAELEGFRITFGPDPDGHVATGVITDVTTNPDGFTLAVTPYGATPVEATPVSVYAAIALLRRCEADRRILARHRRDPDCLAWAACKGCGNDDWGLPNVENINDCPELLDLAHAHGINPNILAGLDRPQPPERKVRIQNGRSLADTLGIATPPITTSDVPAALHGPRWKPHH